MKINGPMQNFIAVLAENKRLPLLPEIFGLFDILKAEQEKQWMLKSVRRLNCLMKLRRS